MYKTMKDFQLCCLLQYALKSKPCHSPFSIQHILTEYIDFQPIRVNYYSTSDIPQLFHKVHPTSMLQNMKDICLYKKL